MDRTREIASFARVGSPASHAADEEGLTLRDVRRMWAQRRGVQDHRDVAVVVPKDRSTVLRQPNGNLVSASVISPSEDAFSDARAGGADAAAFSRHNHGELEGQTDRGGLSDVDPDEPPEAHTQRALNRGTPLSSPFKGSHARTEDRRQ